jgi:hypothetical protein
MEAIRNVVLNEEFWYCRECKQEVDERPQGMTSQAALEEIYSDLVIPSLWSTPLPPTNVFPPNSLYTDEEWDNLIKRIESVQ